MVYMSRPLSPASVEVPEAIKQRHQDSRSRYPQLNLSEGEYVISAVRRHPIGILQIWVVIILLIAGCIGAFYALFAQPDATVAASFGDPEAITQLALVGFCVLSIFLVIGGFVATYVYRNNRFYLTN